MRLPRRQQAAQARHAPPPPSPPCAPTPSPGPTTGANATKANRLGPGRPRPGPPPHPDPARHDPQRHPLQPPNQPRNHHNHSTHHIEPPWDIEALQQATAARGSLKGTFFHTDHGSADTSKTFAAECKSPGVTRSKRVVDSSAHNALSESMSAALKHDVLMEYTPGAMSSPAGVRPSGC